MEVWCCTNLPSLQEDLQAIVNNPVKSKFCKQRTLCHSLAGNPVPILTITSPVRSLEERDTKRAVVVTSRVHPGETNGSWMMKGLLDYLTGDSSDAKVKKYRSTISISFICLSCCLLCSQSLLANLIITASSYWQHFQKNFFFSNSLVTIFVISNNWLIATFC